MTGCKLYNQTDQVRFIECFLTHYTSRIRRWKTHNRANNQVQTSDIKFQKKINVLIDSVRVLNVIHLCSIFNCSCFLQMQMRVKHACKRRFIPIVNTKMTQVQKSIIEVIPFKWLLYLRKCIYM